MKYSENPRPVWITELTLMFVLGFTLSTAIWLGLWFYHAQPSQAAAINQKETALETCQGDRERYRGQFEQAQAEREAVSKKLREARSGWGRCLREKSGAPNPADASAPKPE